MRNPNGYGSVYKMKGNRRKPYIAAVTIAVDEKKTRKALGYYATRRDALAALAAYHNQPYDLSAQDITVKEFFEKWTAYRESRPKGQKSLIIYKSVFRNHCKAVFDWRFTSVQSIHIQQLVDSAKSPVIAERIKIIWGLLYKYAMLTGICQTNQAKVIEIPMYRAKSDKHKPFTHDEIRRMWDKTDNELVRYALIYIYTGMRPSELLEIKKSDVYLDERYIIGGLKTEAGKKRTIPIAKVILPFIRALYETTPGENLTNIKTYSSFRHRWLNCYIPEINNHFPHDGRHTCETALDDAGVNKRIIQLIIGHAGKDVDESVYTHKTRQQLIDAIDKIHDVFLCSEM